MKMNKFLAVALVLIASVVGYVIFSYNGLVQGKTAVESQWATVDSKLQRRNDLIPNLVSSVKGSMAQEEKIFTSIAEARVAMAEAKGLKEVTSANQKLEGALTNLMVTMEAYPELKSSENVSTLMTQLEGSENRISVERDRYNQKVEAYNVSLKKFPKSLVAGMTGFKALDFFQADAQAHQVPAVDLSGE